MWTFDGGVMMVVEAWMERVRIKTKEGQVTCSSTKRRYQLTAVLIQPPTLISTYINTHLVIIMISDAPSSTHLFVLLS